MDDKRPDICPYYVGTVLGRSKSAVLCYDWGRDTGTPPAARATVLFGRGAEAVALCMCRGLYRMCADYNRLTERDAATSEAGTEPLRVVLDAMLLDVLRAAEGGDRDVLQDIREIVRRLDASAPGASGSPDAGQAARDSV